MISPFPSTEEVKGYMFKRDSYSIFSYEYLIVNHLTFPYPRRELKAKHLSLT